MTSASEAAASIRLPKIIEGARFLGWYMDENVIRDLQLVTFESMTSALEAMASIRLLEILEGARFRSWNMSQKVISIYALNDYPQIIDSSMILRLFCSPSNSLRG